MANIELIQQARELCEKATPGPWKAKTNSYPQCNGEPWGWIGGVSGHITWSGNSGQVNAAFIAASRTLVPQLCDALEAMTARAEKAEAENRWIPVSERPPEPKDMKHINVLVIQTSALTGRPNIMSVARWNGADWMCKGMELARVTHWRPLPAPPKEAAP